jgi:hypothetical protein
VDAQPQRAPPLVEQPPEGGRVLLLDLQEDLDDPEAQAGGDVQRLLRQVLGVECGRREPDRAG